VNPMSRLAPLGSRSLAGPIYGFTILVFAVLVAYVDRQIMAILITPIKHALALSDLRIGILQGTALNLFYGIAAVPLGLLVDRTKRVRIIFFAALGWAAFTAVSGFCMGFWQLFFCRVGVGISEAGLAPAAYSLIADLFSPRHRPAALTLFYGAINLCASLAIALSGSIITLITRSSPQLPLALATVEPWRLSLFVAAIPGLIVALMVATLREPIRSEVRELPPGGAASPVTWTFFRSNWGTILLLCLALVSSGIGLEALAMWTPTALARAYGELPEKVAQSLGVLFAIASTLGTIIALGLNKIFRKRAADRAPLHTLACGTILSVLALPLLALSQTSDHFLIATALYAFSVTIGCSVGPSLITLVSPNHLRGQIYGLWVCSSVIAASIWPMVIGLLSDSVFHAPDGLLRSVLVIVTPSTLLAVIAAIALTVPLRRTLSLARPQVLNHSDIGRQS